MLDEILKKIVVEIESEEKEVRVGRVSKEVCDELTAVIKDHDASHQAIKEKIEAFIDQVQNEHDCTPYNERKADAWEKIYDELGLSEAERGKAYRIDRVNRVVYVEADEKEEKEFITLDKKRLQ